MSYNGRDRTILQSRSMTLLKALQRIGQGGGKDGFQRQKSGSKSTVFSPPPSELCVNKVPDKLCTNHTSVN